MKAVCNANHCRVAMQPTMFMCPSHWGMVPTATQRAIRSAYAAASSRAQRLSCPTYLGACADAVEAVASQEGRLTRNAFRNLAVLVQTRQMARASSSMR